MCLEDSLLERDVPSVDILFNQMGIFEDIPISCID